MNGQGTGDDIMTAWGFFFEPSWSWAATDDDGDSTPVLKVATRGYSMSLDGNLSIMTRASWWHMHVNGFERLGDMT